MELPDSVVTRAYQLCELVRDVGSGVRPADRLLGGEPEADARAFLEAVDEADTEDRPGRRANESRARHVARLVDDFAGPAFWAQVARAFPHVKSGDLAPCTKDVLEGVMRRAVFAWLARNEPQPTHLQMASFGNVMHEASIGAFGITQTVTGALAAYVGPPSPGQAGDVDPCDFVVTIGSQDDENSEEPGTERTIVHVIRPDGTVRYYEVQ